MSCRWCGKSKHNRTTCPKRLEYIKNNPSSWEAKCHSERTSSKGTRSARCSWCSENGHNKRNCETLMNDTIAFCKKNAAFRTKALEYMRKEGLGIGGLVKIEAWGYNKEGKYETVKDALGMIVDVNWDKINYPADNGEAITVELMNLYDWGGSQKLKQSFAVHPEIVSKGPNHTAYYNHPTVISPGHVMIDNESEWLKGKFPKTTFDRSVTGQRGRDHHWAESKIVNCKTF